MLSAAKKQRGMTLVEQCIVLVIIGILLVLAARSFSAWIQNLRIRAAAESIVTGLQLAKSEAIKRNANVRFSLVTGLGAGCAYLNANSDSSTWHWMLSTIDPVAHSCPNPGSDTGVIQAASREEGTGNSDIRIKATVASITFNGLARISSAATYQVSRGGTANCGAEAESVRCLNVQVSFPGGQIRMCDPAVTSASDTRKCE